jgi:hypothetical protein
MTTRGHRRHVRIVLIWGAQVVGGRDARSLLDVLCQSARYPDLVVADPAGDGASGVTTVRALRPNLVCGARADRFRRLPARPRNARPDPQGWTLLPKPVVANVLEAVATAWSRAVPRGVTAHAL